MFRTFKQLQGLGVQARDGEIGKVREFYFDDKEWTIRYVVVDAGAWLAGRSVLISPQAFGPLDWEGQVLPVDLVREQVEQAPGIDEHQPVSRQYEIDLNAYYGWTSYGPLLPSIAPALPMVDPLTAPPATGDTTVSDQQVPDDPHLRSSRQVSGYHIQARDDRIGKVDDFVFDDETWRISHLVVDTGGLFTGKQVIVSASWVQRVDWDGSLVQVDLDRETVENSPEFDPEAVLDLE